LDLLSSQRLRLLGSHARDLSPFHQIGLSDLAVVVLGLLLATLGGSSRLGSSLCSAGRFLRSLFITSFFGLLLFDCSDPSNVLGNELLVFGIRDLL
jgi:hypothetical protein